MKVIDLLNKIANEETIPDYICLYNENDEQFHTVLCCEENIVHYLDDKGLKLNDEIKLYEIDEEKKIPEKLSTWFSVETKQSKELNIEYANTNFENIYEKINEIIDCLDYLKSKGE